VILNDTTARASYACRRNGDTVRRLVDCLTAAVAIRADVELFHADFDALARHTPPRLATG